MVIQFNEHSVRIRSTERNMATLLAEAVFRNCNSSLCKTAHRKSPFLDMWKYVEIKCQLDATEVLIAYLIACSTCFRHHYAHHQELKSIMQWLLPVVFRAVIFKLLVWCGAEGYVSDLQYACWFTLHFHTYTFDVILTVHRR